MKSFIDVHKERRNLVSIQFLVFSVQALEPVTEQCGTIASATRGKKILVLAKLPADLALALLHHDI